MTTLAGGLIRNCAPGQDVKQWSTSVATRCAQGSPEKRAYVRREGHPSRQDGRRPTRDKQRVAKEYKSHARPEFYASTPPLEALKVVLSEMSTGGRGGIGCATGRCAKGVLPCSSTKKSIRRTAARKITRQVTKTRAGCCTTSCPARATPHKIGRKSWHRHSAISS